MNPFQLALIQMRVDGGAQPANLTRATSRIAEAARRGAQVVLLPEALNLGWTHPSALQAAEAFPEGPSYARLAESARANSVYVCAGLIERAGSKIFNSAILLAPDGRLLLHHRKINELEIGRSIYSLGDRLSVAETPLGRFGLMICADAFVENQVLSRSLALMGAEILLSPCAWAVPAEHDNVREPYGQLWRDNYGPVARQHRLWIAGASNVGPISAGPWAGRKCIGCSLLIGPGGEEVLMGPYGEEADTILEAQISP
jgi:predicted amidohydrolase